ncbi:MAG: serine protease [Acidobacteria bacterium]|nr:serine protease [Acidobacteriota bacterium]MCA1651878.1 serine protease [Acidobacteriota bacterium]
MSTRRTVPVLTVIFALIFAGLGNYLAARQSADREERFAALSAEVDLLRKQETDRTAGTSGTRPGAPATSMDDDSRASLIADVKRQLQVEMGLLPLALLRERRESFAELYAYDNKGTSSYGTAGYLGNGYFITVKHGVMALGQEGGAEPRRIVSVKLVYKGGELPARVVDAGTARVEVDPGDWAILKVKESVDLPPLTVNLSYGFDFADPIFRLGNDYSKGIILATGYVGQRTANKLVTCLTDGHPGVSGGGVLNRDGELVGIPIGRMQGDYRFSFILPLRAEMFRKVQF